MREPVALPEPPPIDRTRGGALRIALPVLADLLKLPAGHEIARARVIDRWGRQELEVIVEGGDMPPLAEGKDPQAVQLLVFQEERVGVDRRRQAAWAHAQDKRWTIWPWSKG
jgi:hypothetical protein